MTQETTPYIVTQPGKAGPMDHTPPVILNGFTVEFALGEIVDLTDAQAGAIRACDVFEIAPVDEDEAPVVDSAPEEPEPTNPDSPAVDDGASDGAASPDGGAADGSADTQFDAEQVIVGTVAEVEAKLADLTPEQLEAVRVAEIDREKPRVGVTRAIDELIANKQE